MNILAAFAQLETQLRRERQLEGIAKAKESGIYKRAPKTDKILEPNASGLGPAIARAHECAGTTVYRALRSNWQGA